MFKKDTKKLLEQEINEKQQKLNAIKDEELKAKKSKQRQARREKVAKQQRDYRVKKFGLDKPTSERILLLMLHISQATNPYEWIRENVRKKDSYNLKAIFAKIDSLEAGD